MKIYFFIWIVLLSMGANAVASAQAKTDFSFGWESWPPYYYKDENNALAGLDMELVTAIMQHAGLNVIAQEMPWLRHLQEVEMGRVDLAASAGKNAAREKYAYYSDPYRTESAALFVLKDHKDAFDFASIEEMLKSSFNLGIVNGYYYGDTVATYLANPDKNQNIHGVTSDISNIRKLLSNRLDGFLMDEVAASQMLKEEGVLDKIQKHPVIVYEDDIHVMFSKKSTTLDDVEKFNQSLQELRDNGTYNRIYRKYLIDF